MQWEGVSQTMSGEVPGRGARDLTARLVLVALQADQLGRPDRHHLGAGGWAVAEVGGVAVDPLDADLIAGKYQVLTSRVGPGAAIRVVDDRGVRDGPLDLPAHLLLGDRRRLETDPLGERHAVEIGTVDRLNDGRFSVARLVDGGRHSVHR